MRGQEREGKGGAGEEGEGGGEGQEREGEGREQERKGEESGRRGGGGKGAYGDYHWHLLTSYS